MKNNGIWIIEDEYSAYSTIRETLIKEGYSIYPDYKSNETFFDYKKELLNYVGEDKLVDFVSKSLENSDFKAIICDIKLGSDDDNSGEKIIKLIRLNLMSYNSIENSIPIFIMTKYKDKGKNAIKYGAYHFEKYFSADFGINTDKEEIFLETLKFKISEFESDKRIKDILKPSFIEYQSMMIKHNKMVESQIDNIKVIFQSNSENILSEFNSSFGLLLKLSLEQFKHSNINAYEQFTNKFDEEIINEIGQVNYDELINEIEKVNNTWGGSFKELLKNGSIEDAVKYLGATLAIPSGGISSLIAFSINLLIKNLK